MRSLGSSDGLCVSGVEHSDLSAPYQGVDIFDTPSWSYKNQNMQSRDISIHNVQLRTIISMPRTIGAEVSLSIPRAQVAEDIF